MKEFSREWFIAQGAASSKVVDSWPEAIRKNIVLASASLPTISPTKAGSGKVSSSKEVSHGVAAVRLKK